MSETARAAAPSADGPTIARAQLGAAHDGLPELILGIRFENGVLGNVIVDNDAGIRLLARCGVDRIEDLVGQSWREVRNALLEE